MVGGQGITVSPKHTFKLIGSGSSFLRKGFGLRSNSAKRKSAVELLQESKAFYVKSEKVLDTKQELKHSEHLQVNSNPNIELLLKAPKNNNNIAHSNGIIVGDTKPPLPTPRRSPSNVSNGTIEAKRKSSEPALSNGVTHCVTTRPRSKTQPETILRSDAPTNGKIEYRRNHSENMRHCSDSLQKMLRGLLERVDSKENINNKSEDNPPIRSGDAILKPRQQQDCNYSIHKSMPDLSPTKLGIGRSPKARSSRATSPTPTNTTITETSTSGSLSLLVHKSVDLKRSHSHNTSDYVSCSPSTKEDGIKTGLHDLSLVQESDNEEVEVEARRRPILRSKSDISHRFSKCTTEFLDTKHRVVCKSDGELERFFNCMGIEVNTLRTILSPPLSSNSPVFFSSESSIDSSRRDREATESSPLSVRRTPVSVTDGLNSKDLKNHGHAETSIVERNARVIKWLFNCRKAKEISVKS